MIVPIDRLYSNWGDAGVNGGIPDRTQTIFTTLNPIGGTSDDRSQIQTALTNCPTGQVVLLASGQTFRISSDLDFSGVGNGKVLRAASGATINVFGGSWIYLRGSFYDPSGSGSIRSALTASASQGDTSITVADASWISVGDCVVISNLDDTSFVNQKDEEDGNATSYVYAGNRGFGQLVRVTAKVSNTLTLELPLCWDFTTGLTAQVAKVANTWRTTCGLEDLVLNIQDGDENAQVIRLECCQNCWVDNCTISDARLRGIQADFAYRATIRHSTVVGGTLLGSGQGYGISLYNNSCYCLITDNILEALHVGIQLSYGAMGNVISYNFEYIGAADSGQSPAVAGHGYHIAFNLFEGNYTHDKFLFDNTHGSGSHHTLLRNRCLGYNPNLSYDTTAIRNMAWNRFANFVGNILGTDGIHTVTQTWYPSAFNPDTNKVVIRGGDDADLIRDVGDSLATSDPIIEGNWDSVSDTVTWTITPEAIPDSYYLTEKPENFGFLAWPPYTSSDGNSVSEEDIPAGYRYVHGVDPPAGGDVTVNTTNLTATNLIIG